MISDSQYFSLCLFFQNMKTLHGPEFVNATLRRHKKLYLALQDYEKTHIVDLESKLFSEESDNDD